MNFYHEFTPLGSASRDRRMKTLMNLNGLMLEISDNPLNLRYRVSAKDEIRVPK
jgi:hypothetical protein